MCILSDRNLNLCNCLFSVMPLIYHKERLNAKHPFQRIRLEPRPIFQDAVYDGCGCYPICFNPQLVIKFSQNGFWFYLKLTHFQVNHQWLRGSPIQRARDLYECTGNIWLRGRDLGPVNALAMYVSEVEILVQ